MANFFDQFDGEPVGTVTPEEKPPAQNYFDQFDEPQKTDANQFDQPNIERENRGWIDNGVRGAGKFLADMGAGIVDAMSVGSEAVPSGILGVPSYATQLYPVLPKEERTKLAENYHQNAEELRQIDTGFIADLNTLDGAQAQWQQGNKMAAIGQGARAIGEAALQTAPAIAGTMLAPQATIPVLAVGTTGDMANSRAENKGLERPTGQEFLEVAPYAAAVTALDAVFPLVLRKFNKGITETAADNIAKSASSFLAKKTATGAAAGVAEESLTEGSQELLQYVGERYGTQAKMELDEAWRSAWQAAVLGGGVGGALGGAHGAAEGVAQMGNANAGAQPLDSGIDQPISGEQLGGGIIDDMPQSAAQPVSTPQEAIGADETLSANAQPAPGAFDEIGDYANQQADSARQADAAQRVRYLDDESNMADAARQFGEQNGLIKKTTLQETPDDIEQSLNQETNVDDEINQLLNDVAQHHEQAKATIIHRVNAAHHEAANKIFDDRLAAAKQSAPAKPSAFDKREAQSETLRGILDAAIDRARAEQLPPNMADVRLLRTRYKNHLSTVRESLENYGDALHGVDGLLDVARKNGRLNAEAWAKEGLDPVDMKKNTAFSATGKLTPDDLAELAQQNGFMGFANEHGTPDANRALNAVDDELRGIKQHNSMNDESKLQLFQNSPEFIKELKGYGSAAGIKTAITKALEGKSLGSHQIKIVQEVLDRANSHARDDSDIKARWEVRARKMLADKGNSQIDEWRNREDHQYNATTHEAAITEIMTDAMQYHGIDPDKVKAAYEQYSARYPSMNQLTAAMMGWVSSNKTDSTEHLQYERREELPRRSSGERGALEKQSGLPSGSSAEETVTAPERSQRTASLERGSDSARRDAGLRQPVTPSSIDDAAHQAATSPLNDLPQPTLAQKEAGNYQKGHVSIHGLDISIENPKGSTRSGTDPNGKKWKVNMNSHYGYIKRTEGADGDHVDVFVGNNPGSDNVFIVDQIGADGAFDEHKVMLGFDTIDQAKSSYLKNYTKGWKVGPIKSLSINEFKDWLKNSDTTKPVLAKPAVGAATTEESNSRLLEKVPPSILKNLKVDYSVFNESTNAYENKSVTAKDALKSINEDIQTFESLLKCVRGE